MTDRNPGFDPADIHGSVSTDPHADADDTEDLPGNYRTPDGADSTQCSICSKPSPEAEVQCPFCAGESLIDPTVKNEQAVDEWSFGRVVLAVVKGNTRYHAQAVGSAAFAVSDDLATGTEATHATVKCRAAFDAEPASQLTDGWPFLPDIIRADRSVGQTLLDVADEQTDWERPDTEPRVFVEDGDGLTEYSQFEALATRIEESEGEYWLVPGIVQEYSVGDPASLEHRYYCVECQEPAPHSYAGRDGFDSAPVTGREIWTCDVCDHPRFLDLEEESSESGEERPREWLPDDVSYEDVHAVEPLPHEREFDQQITDYYERHERYPWE
ncbi:hypothetical protein [Haloarcula nitratireducens]|uniref:Uncharacterized protein n=1 Tax=Haloarcula nitratireducens TaxID=2487749 RepID=A0AAW4PHA0_9EURY|nr:hypothetical protein [Halomicroarcula nitratireducens]MBX0297209.1 hypothetical protein [Halomicroarcula nitratireducens]